MTGPVDDGTTVVVTVTYGNRNALLTEVLASLQDLPLARVVVIDNGSAWPLKPELTAAYSGLIDVVEMDSNTGSATGYSTGIERALELGAEYIWLLDDDNRPRSDTLRKLHEAYSSAAIQTPRELLAVLAFRPKHYEDVAMGLPTHRLNPRANSFREFHVPDLPYKICRRTPWGRPRVRGSLRETVAMDMDPIADSFSIAT